MTHSHHTRNGSPNGTPHLDGDVTETLLRTRRFLQPAAVSADLRTLHQIGGRDADTFYRDRWSHDKVVRSTHGVNCTGSCSWKVYVKDGIITWEAQQTDYPSAGADRPEYEPRGCPRGAAFSWYTYSPTRVRYPYVRGSLLQMYRAAKARHGDPVAAWASIVDDPGKARLYKSHRGHGGLVRATWEEVVELVAAAHVHTIKRYGPDRVAGFSPIPAMSMVSFAAGSRFVSLIGGAMLSFYDWYADLPVASPQVFGDQTDVPESGDWWDASYLILWGSNVPVTRTPDAHWMTEARYRGQKVVVMSPDYSDATKFADDWLAPHPGTDGALAMAMGHVVLKEFFVDRETPRFVDYCKRYTDLPFLVTLDRRGDAFVPDKFLTAADLPDELGAESGEGAAFKTVLVDGRSGEPTVPNGTLGDRFTESGKGRWNLDLGEHRPAADTARRGGGRGRPAALRQPRRRGRGGAARRAGSRGRRAAGHHGLRPPARPVRRRQARAARELAHRVRRPVAALHAGVAGAVHGGRRGDRGADRARVRANAEESDGALHDHHGCGDQPLVPLRHDLPRLPRADHADRLPGVNGGGLGALRRAGEVPAGHRLVHAWRSADWVAPAAADDPDRVLVPAHATSGAMTTHGSTGWPHRSARAGSPGRPPADVLAQSARMGWMPSHPTVRPQPARPRPTTSPPPGRAPAEYVVERAAVTVSCAFAGEDPGRTRELPAGADHLAGEPARVLRRRATSTSSSTCSASTRRCGRPRRRPGPGRGDVGVARPGARPGSWTCWSTWTSG